MVTSRCRSFNLLNHIRQKEIPYNVSFTFCNERATSDYLKWVGTFEFNGNTYTGSGRSKKLAISSFMINAEQDVLNYILRSGNNN